MVRPNPTGSGPRRVGLVCPYDLDVPGGVREQVLGLAASLAAAGDDVEVLAPRRRASPPRERVGDVTVVHAGPARGLPANGSTARLALDPLSRARAARWSTSGFDVVHVHEPIPPGIGHTVLRQLAVRRELGLPGPAVVATVHVAMASRPAGRSRSLRTASAHVGGLLRGVDVLTAVSEHARRTLVDHLGRVPLIVPNGVDVSAWRDVGRDTRAGSQWAARDGHQDVVVVGRAGEPRKGVDVLLSAWPDVRRVAPDARLLVIGPAGGLGGGRAALPDGVLLLGTVEEAAKRSLVAAADVLVAPHLGGESFGIVLVEAMAAGTPVVASDLPAFRTVLGGLGTLVPSGAPAALADAVVRALAAPRPDPTRAMRRAAEFDWSVVGARWRVLHGTATQLRDGRGGTQDRPGSDSLAGNPGTLADALDRRARLALSVAGHGTGPWREPLRAAARAALGGGDETAQSRLTAVARDPALPEPGRGQLRSATERVREYRALANDLARRDGRLTMEFDDTWDEPAWSGARDTALDAG